MNLKILILFGVLGAILICGLFPIINIENFWPVCLQIFLSMFFLLLLRLQLHIYEAILCFTALSDLFFFIHSSLLFAFQFKYFILIYQTH